MNVASVVATVSPNVLRFEIGIMRTMGFGILNRETRAGSTGHLLFQTEDGSRSLPRFKRDFGSSSTCPHFKPRQDRAPGQTRTDMTRYNGVGLNRGAIQQPAK
ncbi:hypothetical protein D3C84_894500 [compost metagenome]